MPVSLNTLHRAVHEALYNNISFSGGAEHHTRPGLFFRGLFEKICKALGIKEGMPDTDKGRSVQSLIESVIDGKDKPAIHFKFSIIFEGGEDGQEHNVTVKNIDKNLAFYNGLGELLFVCEGKSITDLYNIALEDRLTLNRSRPS